MSATILLSSGAAAHAEQQRQAPAAEDATLGEIVVTARRRTESLQEVPQTVNAVTAETLQKLNIQQFADIQNVVPGLTLSQSQGSSSGVASLRGITFNQFTGDQPTVAFYLNDAPVSPAELFQTLFDIGQVEVLKGPQGTIRGISAPSGAITVTTRKPSLSEFGGYFDATATDIQGRNVQGALNIPIIKDVLAVRVAGVYDESDNGGVRSVHNALRPSVKSSAERISVSFEPSDAFNANVVYQHFDRAGFGFAQVTGPGLGTAIDPPIDGSDRAAVQDQPSTDRNHLDFVGMQVDSRIFGQHLSYVGAYRHTHSTGTAADDIGNILPGAEFFQVNNSTSSDTTQEIRLSSDPAPGRFFDYTVGAFYSWLGSTVDTSIVNQFMPGAFGPPDQAPNPSALNAKFQVPVLVRGNSASQETSVFGSVTLHLGANTELTGGVRHVISINSSSLGISLGNITLALPSSVLGGSCGAFPSTYPGFCDFTLAGSNIPSTPDHESARPNIYNISLSHHFTRDLLAYFTTGTAFRPPYGVPAAPTAAATSDNPDIRALAFHPTETSRAYEVGVKSTWLDGRARLNVALFRQRFHNLAFYTYNVLIRDPTSGQVSSGPVTANVDALVQGVDVDAALQVTPEWNISVQGSYSHNQLEGSTVPCTTGTLANPNFNTGDSKTPVSQGGIISFCSNGSASRMPLWSLTAQSEYVHPLTDGYDGFLRGLLNYYPQNKYVEPNFAAPSYSLLNLYAGVRSHDGAWEVAVFARNVTGTNKTLDQTPEMANLNGVLASNFPTLNRASGYFQIMQYTPPREVGIHVRYSWGSR